MNNNFKKVHTVKDLTITIMVLITGIGIFFHQRASRRLYRILCVGYANFLQERIQKGWPRYSVKTKIKESLQMFQVINH